MQGGEGEEEVSIEELASILSTYKEHLQLVRQQLADDPYDTKYADMEKELKELFILLCCLFSPLFGRTGASYVPLPFFKLFIVGSIFGIIVLFKSLYLGGIAKSVVGAKF